jgi:hypothetical protein
LIFYLEAFDGILGIFLRNKEPRTLEEAQVVAIKLERDFMAAYGFILIHDFQLPIVKAVQEVCVIKDEPQLAPYQVPRDEQEGYSPILDDPEPIVAPFESHVEFQEDEGEDLNTQECSLVPPISEDEKFQEEEPQVNQVEISQQEFSSLPITVVVRNSLIRHHYNRRSHFWFNQKDDVPFTLPTIQTSRGCSSGS